MPQISYVTCLSWEDRFIESFEINYKEYNFTKIILFYFKDEKFLSLSNQNLQIIKSFASKKNIILDLVPLLFENQIEVFKKTSGAISQLTKSTTYLNITTMPRHLLYITLDILIENKINFDILYYIPKSYGNEIAKNPDIPKLLVKHSGIFEADKETLLIISSGLDKERIFQLYYHFEPNKIILLQEEKNLSNIKDSKRDTFNKDLFDEIFNLEIYMIDSFSENNIYDFLNNNLLDEIEKYNTLLCSIGPKIASLELFKFNKFFPKCGIVYALSKDYSKEYSQGLDNRHKFVRSSTYFNQ